ncbi:poly(A)-specific ribonuclease [Ascosphaera aggregata]|nr:poly(A)-specific ribonuclease [Ascosphaera aggregata]
MSSPRISSTTVGGAVVHTCTYSSFPDLINQCEEFSQEDDTRFGRIVFTQIPSHAVDKLIVSQDNHLLKAAKLTYQDSTLELKMPYRPHEVGGSRIAHAIARQLDEQGYSDLVVDYGLADIEVEGKRKRPDHSWGPFREIPDKSTDPSYCKMVLEVGVSEGPVQLERSARLYLEAGIPYILLLDVAQRRRRISLHLFEAFIVVGSRSFAPLHSGYIVASRDDSGADTSQGDPIRVPIAALADKMTVSDDGTVVITAETLKSVAQHKVKGNMDPDWDEISSVPVPHPAGHPMPTVASTIAFDPQQELVWVGNDFGRICSFYGPELHRYTSTTAHPRSEGPVQQLLFHNSGVVSLTAKSVHLTSRRGLTQWHLHTQDMEALQCMAFTTNPNRIIVAGLQSCMLVIDLEKGAVIETVKTQYRYTLLRKSRYLIAATDKGFLNVISFADWRIVKTWKAHGTIINDMDTRNDLLVTCGLSLRPTGTALVDPLANVYDLKTLQHLPPIPFHAGAAFVRMHPKLQTTAFISSQTGQLQVVDLMNPNAINLRQVNVSLLLGLETSNSGEALLFNDAECMIRLWGSPTKVHFNELSKEVEFADIIPRPPVIDWASDVPLNLVGMPYYKDTLLSAWPSHLVFDMGKPPEKVDPSVLQYMRPGELGHYASFPRKTRRYQVESNRSGGTSEPALIAPRFLSEKARTGGSASDADSAAEALAFTTLTGEKEEDPLLKYSGVEIKYSRFGVDDFDFKFYNKTEYSGLETHIANSFTNALLQLFKFTPLLRNIALHHAATNCMTATCLLCEMGFLFDMLDKAQGENCQATNLLKTFSSYREAANLGLFEENLTSKTLESTIQAVHRFFLKQIGQDFRNLMPNSDVLDHTISTAASESIRCMYCGREHIRVINSYITDLVYPPCSDPKQYRRNPNCRFGSILRTTVHNEQQSRGWCQNCRRYQQMAMRKTTHRLPMVLTVNAGMMKHNARGMWAVPGFLPEQIGLTIENGRVNVFEGEELKARRRMNTSTNLVEYELVGIVAEIDIPEQSKPHLVSFINVSISSRQPESKNRWYLFNDFLVTEVQRDEALSFQQMWKTPCTMTYQVKKARHIVDDTWKEGLDSSLLFFEYSLNNRRPTPLNQILAPTEKPTSSTPVALDTEFVDLEKAEIEVKADGTQEMIRPSKSGLARVSVIRGSEGPKEGIPFIDDYITINDPIVDYVTQYSGIKPGDLDLRLSQHNLVPLKIAYKKLWILLNLGCVFVGHGLASDFRKINIKVPKKQTVDTQYLYFHPGKNRRLSLRYLAWAVFKEYIQEDPVPTATTTSTRTATPTTTSATAAAVTSAFNAATETAATASAEGHDSIEDARMALRLWKKFQEFTKNGTVSHVLEEIFREGVRLGFRPPPRMGGVAVSPPKVIAPPSVDGAGNGVGGSGRNTPDPAILGGVGTSSVSGGGVAMSVPSTPRQGFRRETALTPNDGSFTGINGQVSEVFGGGNSSVK